MAIDLDSVDSTGPFDPKRLVEQALLQLRSEMEEKKQRAAGTVAAARARLAELIKAAGVFTDSRTLLERAKGEIAQPFPSPSPDPGGAIEDLLARCKLVIAMRETAEESLAMIKPYMDKLDRYGSIAKRLGQFDRIAPSAERQAMRSRLKIKAMRAGVFLLGLAATVVVESLLAELLESGFNLVIPTYARIVSIAVLYIIGLLAIEIPLERWQERVLWRLFERIRIRRRLALASFQEIEVELTTLASDVLTAEGA